MWITDRHDMTLAVRVALNLNTTNQQSKAGVHSELLTLSQTIPGFYMSAVQV